MNKFYRVKKDNFMWKEGAILSNSSHNGNGYVPIEDVWNSVPLGTEYISAHIIENAGNSEYFERVYPDNISGKLYRTKDQVVEMYKSSFK